MDRKFIEDFAAGGEKLKKAIDGLTKEDMLWVPPRAADIGLWSVQQIVLHLTDDELIWTTRMKSVVAEEHPKILGYDESKYASHLFYEAQDPQVALQMFDLNRRLFAIVLRHLPDSAFERRGEHNDIGFFTLGQALEWINEHLDHHIHYISLKREKMGKVAS